MSGLSGCTVRWGSLKMIRDKKLNDPLQNIAEQEYVDEIIGEVDCWKKHCTTKSNERYNPRWGTSSMMIWNRMVNGRYESCRFFFDPNRLRLELRIDGETLGGHSIALVPDGLFTRLRRSLGEYETHFSLEDALTDAMIRHFGLPLPVAAGTQDAAYSFKERTWHPSNNKGAALSRKGDFKNLRYYLDDAACTATLYVFERSENVADNWIYSLPIYDDELKGFK